MVDHREAARVVAGRRAGLVPKAVRHLARGTAAPAVLSLAVLSLAGCLTTPEPVPEPVAGNPRDKVLEAYGPPMARQHTGNVEVWQYCEKAGSLVAQGDAAVADGPDNQSADDTAAAASDEDDRSHDRLHLVWLVDGVVVGESHHRYELDGCRSRYIVDVESLPLPPAAAAAAVTR